MNLFVQLYAASLDELESELNDCQFLIEHRHSYLLSQEQYNYHPRLLLAIYNNGLFDLAAIAG